MKAFIAACICFALLSLFLFGSAALLSRQALSLSREASELAEAPVEDREAGASALCDRWDKERIFFVIFVHEEELAPLESALTRARAAAKIKSDSDFAIAVAEVLSELEHVEWLVGTHLESLL